MFRLRPLLWPTLISLPILVLCLALGFWQMERREWKRDILDRIAANQSSPPIALDELLNFGRPKRVQLAVSPRAAARTTSASRS